jgi:hypothetical protein
MTSLRLAPTAKLFALQFMKPAQVLRRGKYKLII